MEVVGELLQRLIELTGLSDTHIKFLGAMITLAIFLIGIGLALYARYVLRKNHSMRRFHQQVVIQRHIHQQDQDVVRMGIRTIWSGTLDQIFKHDPVMQDKIIAAARRTSEKNPFVILSDEDDQAIMVQTFVNFTGWKLPEDAGTHVLTVTAEADAGRSRKIRVLLLEDSDEASQIDMYIDKKIAVEADNPKLQGPRIAVLRLFATAAINSGKHGNDVVTHVVAPAWGETDDTEIHISAS